MQSLPPRSWLLRLLLIAATFTTAFQQASQPLPAQTPESRQAAHASPPDTRLDRIEPVEAHEAPETFELVDGYRLELVAAEPLVNDPVAFCFDARGRLIVVEMRGYSERPEDLAGRVRRLSDRDGDGRMDTAETLIDELSWPTAVACWGDGVLVAVAPISCMRTDETRRSAGSPVLGEAMCKVSSTVFGGGSTIGSTAPRAAVARP